MPAFAYLKKIFEGTVTAGKVDAWTWKPDEDVIIHRLFIINKAGSPLFKFHVTITVDNVAYTKDEVPAALLGSDIMNAIVLDIPVPKYRELKISYKNNEGSDVDLWVIAEVYK